MVGPHRQPLPLTPRPHKKDRAGGSHVAGRNKDPFTRARHPPTPLSLFLCVCGCGFIGVTCALFSSLCFSSFSLSISSLTSLKRQRVKAEEEKKNLPNFFLINRRLLLARRAFAGGEILRRRRRRRRRGMEWWGPGEWWRW